MARKNAMTRTVSLLAVAVIALSALAVYQVLTPPQQSTTTSASTHVPLVTYSADAYSAETQALLTAFSTNTGLPVAPVKSGGSFADAGQIAAGAPDDIFVSVSLSATGPTYLKNLSSNWAIGFASDQMVLAYSNATQTGPAAAKIISSGQHALSTNDTADWNSFFTSLTSGGVKVGISNPVSDPAGLRGWLVLEAAGHLNASGDQEAYASSLIGAKANVTGADAAALMASLQSGQIQFLFIYKSAAISHHLGYLALDRHLNLSDPNLASYYSQFKYSDSAGTSAASPIVLVVTVPSGSLSQTEALEFVGYLVRNAASLEPYGLEVFTQARLYHNVAPPGAVHLQLTQGLLLDAGPYH